MTTTGEKYPSLDFYQFLKPFQNLFQMTHGKQKDWEQFLGLNREDKYDGGQLIAVYKDYLMSKDEDLLHNLLLHNEDDLLGMKYLLPLFSYRQIFLEDITLQRIAPTNKVFERGNGSIAISCRLPLPLPQPLEVSTPIGDLFSDKKDLSILTITLPFVEDVLKHFYKDYHNYYYLPKEERWIDYTTGKEYEGGQTIKVDAPLNTIPGSKSFYLLCQKRRNLPAASKSAETFWNTDRELSL